MLCLMESNLLPNHQFWEILQLLQEKRSTDVGPDTASADINGNTFNYFSGERIRLLGEGMKMHLHTNEPASAGEKACCVKTANCECKSKRDSAFMFAKRQARHEKQAFQPRKMDINSVPQLGHLCKQYHPQAVKTENSVANRVMLINT